MADLDPESDDRNKTENYNSKDSAAPAKKNLEIEIDDNEDYDT
jgi:hypothetical protein